MSDIQVYLSDQSTHSGIDGARLVAPDGDTLFFSRVGRSDIVDKWFRIFFPDMTTDRDSSGQLIIYTGIYDIPKTPPASLTESMTSLLLDVEKTLITHDANGDCRDLHHQTCCDIASKYALWDNEDRFPLWLSILVQSTGRELGLLDNKE